MICIYTYTTLYIYHLYYHIPTSLLTYHIIFSIQYTNISCFSCIPYTIIVQYTFYISIDTSGSPLLTTDSLQDLDQFRQSQEGTNRTSHPVTVIRISGRNIGRKHQDPKSFPNWAQKTSDEWGYSSEIICKWF